MDNRQLGNTGEIIAKEFLISKGYDYLCSNYKYMRREIDLIFKDEKSRTLIFVEVKTRKNKNYGEPEESVTRIKQEHLRTAALGYLAEKSNYRKYDLRFDVVTILINQSNKTINHIENAF